MKGRGEVKKDLLLFWNGPLLVERQVLISQSGRQLLHLSPSLKNERQTMHVHQVHHPFKTHPQHHKSQISTPRVNDKAGKFLPFSCFRSSVQEIGTPERRSQMARFLRQIWSGQGTI